MGERELRGQIRHLLVELDIVTGLLRASQQTTEIVALLKILARRWASFERSGFRHSFTGARTNPPSPPATPFPLSCSPDDALRRLALCCEATAELHETPGLGVRKSDLLSFAETLREGMDGVKSRPPVSLEQVAASAAWKAQSADPLLVICDIGLWNHQSRGIGNATCHAIFRGKSVPRAVKITPTQGFHPALRLVLNERYPDSHQRIHVIVENSRSVDILASPPLSRDERPRVETERVIRGQLEKRRVSLDNSVEFFRSF